MITTTKEVFQPQQILSNLVSNDNTGYLRVNSNSVNWEIYLQQGQLKFASYSLQSYNSIKHILLRHNFRESVKSLKEYSVDSIVGKSVFTIVEQLYNEKLINNEQYKILSRELTQEAIELFLCLKEGSSQYSEENSQKSSIKHKYDSGWDTPTLFDQINKNLEAWQQFYPLITSPFARIFCPNLDLLDKRIANGNLSPALLKRIFTLIQGGSIRQIAVALKTTDLRGIQLLFPYLKNEILRVKTPNAPFDRLALIPHDITVSKLSSKTFLVGNPNIQSKFDPLNLNSVKKSLPSI